MEDWYYAVVIGRCTGIFTNVDDALAQTLGYSNAKFVKFPTFGAAQNFLNGYNLDVGMTYHLLQGGYRTWFGYEMDGNRYYPPEPKHPDTLVAFCDGSALGNGKRFCSAASACIFPNNRDWDVVKYLNETWATNNRAEYMAALEAMERANMKDYYGDKVLYIYSDSSVLIKAMTMWIQKWQINGWREASGKEVKNHDILERLVDAQGNRSVLWRHVRAHTEGRNWASLWNDIADSTARREAKKHY